jgi:short subunit fatty acids transporter
MILRSTKVMIAVFWALLAPENGFASTKDLWSNTSQHALNSLYALFEIVFPRTEPLPFLHIIVIVVVLALYLSLAYLTHAVQGWYTYDFLDLDKHSSGKKPRL